MQMNKEPGTGGIGGIGAAQGQATAPSAEVSAKVGVMARNVDEMLTREDLIALLESGKRLSAYYGTTPTGPVHIGYLIPLSKVFDFQQAGIPTKILIADIHAVLDDQKSKWDELERRTAYYKKCVELALPWKEMPKFYRGSDFELKESYVKDLFRLTSMTTVKRATRAAAEVTRMKDTKVSELMYPVMQALDEEHLDVDIQLGGVDQRHVMIFARECLGLLGYRKRVEMMTPLLLSLQGPGAKMSASAPESNIKVYESEESIKKKISKAYCPMGSAQDNPVLQISKFLIFGLGSEITIHQRSGQDLEVKSYESLEAKYVNGEIHPADLKPAVAEQVIRLFTRAREYFSDNTDILKDLGETFMP